MIMHVLNYARPVPRQEAEHLLHTARLCGQVPLIGGCIIFFLWLVTRSPLLFIIGLADILFGLILFVAGAACVLVYVGIEVRAGSALSNAYAWRRAAGCVGWLLLNFPVCGAFIFIALEILNGR